MLPARRIAPAIRNINHSVISNIRSLSTPPTRLKIYETEKVVKFVYVPQPTPAQKKTGNTDPKENNENYVENPLGRFYQSVVHKGREGRSIGLNDLRKMINQCEKPEDVKYATKLYELLQTKGSDFSEDINGHYVDMCIKFDRLDVIVKEFPVFKNRLAAWTTGGSFERMIEAAERKGETATMLPVMHTLAKKGVKMREHSVLLLIRAAAKTCDEKLYGHTIFYAGKVFGEEVANGMALSHPLEVAVEPVAVVDAVVEGEGEAAPVCEEGAEK